jgi:oligoendopeptidase F
MDIIEYRKVPVLSGRWNERVSASLIHLKGADDILQWDRFLPVLVKANSYSIDVQDTVTSIGQNHQVLMLG